ncbi:MAG: hypothetical protein IJ272_05420 [Clostridia bacterium]|nr:hypothetical protein [Clostridia bacterium]
MNLKLENYTNNITTKYNNISKDIKTKDDKNTSETSQEQPTDDTAVVYEKSSDNVKNNTSNNDIIAQLKFDVEQRTNQMYSLVQKMFNKQGITFNTSEEMFNILRTGNFTADPETIAKAKEDISEDGYWGVKQTSERLVSFAKALSGNDPEQADKMIEAVKKGFDQATKTWGGELPDICKQTLDSTIEKLESWRDSLTQTTETEEIE